MDRTANSIDPGALLRDPAFSEWAGGKLFKDAPRCVVTLTQTDAGWLVARRATTVAVGPYPLATALRAAGCLARGRDVSAAALDPDELADIAEALEAEAAEAQP